MESQKPSANKTVLHLRSSGGLLGAENVILELTKYSNLYGYTPIIGALLDVGDPIPEFITLADQQGIRTQLFTAHSKVDHQCIKMIKHFCQKESVDLLHTHGYREDIFGLMAAPSIKKVATNHLWKNTNQALKMYAWIDSLALRFYHKIIAVSDNVLQDMKAKGLPEHKMITLSNGIDLNKFSATTPQKQSLEIKEQLKLPLNSILITMVSSLTPEKGHKVAIKAFKTLTKNISHPVHLLIVGDGPEKSELMSMCDELDLSKRITFTGKRTDIPDLLGLSDIFLLSSYIEGLPMALLEAMASSKAIVATNVGDVAFALDQGAGIVIQPGKDLDMANGLKKLIEDDEHRIHLGTMARQRVESYFSSQTMTEKYCKIYDALMA